jgi:hypothetical protein
MIAVFSFLAGFALGLLVYDLVLKFRNRDYVKYIDLGGKGSGPMNTR